MLLDDLNASGYVVLPEHESPLRVCGVKRADTNISFFEGLEQIAEGHGCILGIPNFGVHTSDTRNACDALDARLCLDVRANDGLHAVFFVVHDVSYLNWDAHFVHGLNGSRMQDGGVCARKLNRLTVAQVRNR